MPNGRRHAHVHAAVWALLLLCGAAQLRRVLATPGRFHLQHGSHEGANTTAPCVMACVPVKDEENWLPFLVDSFHAGLPDALCSRLRFMVLDHGSSDLTLPLLQSIFRAQLASGWLTLVTATPGGPEGGGLDIANLRNLCLAAARARGCAYTLKLEADSVWYDGGAADAVRLGLEEADPAVRCHGFDFELAHQNTSWTTEENLHSIILHNTGAGAQQWYTRRLGPVAALCRVRGAVARGKWTDEQHHRAPESIYYASATPGSGWGGGNWDIHPVDCPHRDRAYFLHYSSARAVVRNMHRLQAIGAHISDRCGSVRPEWYSQFEPFTSTHPEAFQRLKDRYLAAYAAAAAARGTPPSGAWTDALLRELDPCATTGGASTGAAAGTAGEASH